MIEESAVNNTTKEIIVDPEHFQRLQGFKLGIYMNLPIWDSEKSLMKQYNEETGRLRGSVFLSVSLTCH